MKDIQITEDLFNRLAHQSVRFETPVDVIEKILTFYENEHGNTSSPEPAEPAPTTRLELPEKLDIIYYPGDEKSFKELFLQTDSAYVLLYFKDGKRVLKEWIRSNFTQDSSVNGNLRSGYLRRWRDKGIIKAEVSTKKEDLI